MPVLRQVLCLDYMKKTQVILKAQRLVLLGVLFIFLCIFKFLVLIIMHFFPFYSLFFFFPILFYFILFYFFYFFDSRPTYRSSTSRCVDRHSTDISVDILTDISVEGCTKYTWSDFFVSKLLSNLLVLPGPGKSVKCKRKETSDRNHSTGKRRTSRWSLLN